jgi:hypothetical protein
MARNDKYGAVIARDIQGRRGDLSLITLDRLNQIFSCTI